MEIFFSKKLLIFATRASFAEKKEEAVSIPRKIQAGFRCWW